MKHFKTGRERAFFKVLGGTRGAQAASMILPPGQSSGESGNEHPRCEQWLFVVSGSGRATVNKRRLLLRPQSLLVIEKGEVHQVVNTGAVPLRTINLYIPPAYEKNGAVKRTAKSAR